ncbi:Polyketide synthase [Phytophthora palmivora]|uniref:Polyketide synthase n=1 Tax=Phytophthora palmivora TaxID=4796 RepID=A0A2P4XZU1_9STRA|nr:Polyketide synthase [Phytophthora palmivora]
MVQTRHIDSRESYAEAPINEDELDAHHQVLGMAAAIEQLTQDFARQQEELAAAYKRLQQYGLQEQNGEGPKAHSSVRSGDNCGCAHESELEELKRLLEVKDMALAEALQQRNQHRVELEKAEALIAELRSLHLDTTGGRVPQMAWKVNPPPGPGSISTHTITRSIRSTATAVQYAQANVGIRTPMSPAATANLLGCPGAMDVPHDERFDVESTYKQRTETGDVFWRKQYKEAVRMRKTPSILGQQSAITGQQYSTPQPSLKIFSCPDNRKKKTDQLRDETVPSTRYIGISSKQNNIIKEQHRMLMK